VNIEKRLRKRLRDAVKRGDPAGIEDAVERVPETETPMDSALGRDGLTYAVDKKKKEFVVNTPIERTTLNVDGSRWRSVDDVYNGLLSGLKAPEWHGRNLDALWDSLSSDQINGVRAPFEAHITSAAGWTQEIEDIVSQISALFADARQGGVDISMTVD
jgi:RNAse (barnase) inhibitor barstar